jgi:hypothetical protein
MKVPALPPFPEAKLTDGKPSSPEHAFAAHTGYVAYFGTYTVDPEKRVVTHHVEGSLEPDFTDTHQSRRFKLEGDRMEIARIARLGGVCWNVCADLVDSCGVARRHRAIAMVGDKSPDQPRAKTVFPVLTCANPRCRSHAARAFAESRHAATSRRTCS